MPKLVLAMTSVKPGGDDALEQYLSVVGQLMENSGAKLISRYEVSGNLTGSELPQFVSIVEYPDAAAIQKVFDHEDYKSLKPVREMAFSRYDICTLD